MVHRLQVQVIEVEELAKNINFQFIGLVTK